MWGLDIASEKKMRKEAKQLVGDNLRSEMVPFTFKHRDGGEIIKEAAMAYVPNLWLKIEDLLNQSSDKTKRYYNYSIRYPLKVISCCIIVHI